MRCFLFIIHMFCCFGALAQATERDTLQGGMLVVEKDTRVDALGKKMVEYNEALSRKTHLENGYRLMLMSSADRDKVMALRAKLLQMYPEHKLYTVFQSPYIKLKFGNFLDKDEAERMKKQIASLKLVEGNIYVVPEKVEVKPDKKEDGAQEN